MLALTQIIVAVGLLATGIIYGTDAFAALVLRPALRDLNDRELTRAAGRIHHYGDSRLPAPGVVGMVATVLATILVTIEGSVAAAGAAGVSVICLVVWMVLYLRIAAPINRTLRVAAETGDTPADVRALQGRWDSIITHRACLQGAALLGLALTLVLL